MATSAVYLQESSGWQLTAGYLGSVRVTVPLAALHSESCCIEVEEALFTVRPAPRGAKRSGVQCPTGASRPFTTQICNP